MRSCRVAPSLSPMSEFSGVRRLVWVPVLVGLAATTLTGCKKTTHAAKPLANISQAVVASATSSTAAVATPATAPAATSSASVSASPSAVASLSATVVPVAPPPVKTGAGCSLIPLSAVASALGVASVTTKTYVTTLHPPIIAHQGCQYLAGAAGAGWDINTFSTGAPPQALLAAEMAKVPGARQTTIDGLPGYAIVLPGGTGEEVALYKGSQDIVILTHGKTGASIALAQLIAAAI
jgi:hypothetical protein